MTKELFYLAMAALGGYAAWLAIQEYKAKQLNGSILTAGAFTGSRYDFYDDSVRFL